MIRESKQRTRLSPQRQVQKTIEKPPYHVPSMREIEALPWNGYKVVSTFSGTGGSCLGYRMAGYRVLWANEFIPAAQDSYKANHPHSILDPRDIRKIQPEEILQAINLEQGEIDIFDGSPPCASFSTAGKREAAWGKVKEYSDTKQRVDDLFFEYARLLKGLQPKVFVAENVSGLIKGTAKGYFLNILKELKGCGYEVVARVLDAQWLGVPQMRQRLIFIGVRNDLVQQYDVHPIHPKPLPYYYTVREALPWIIRQGDNGGFGKGAWQDASLAPSGTLGASPQTGNGKYPPSLVEAITGIEEANGFNSHAFSSVDQPAATVQAGRSLLAQYEKVPVRAIHDTSGQFSNGDITDQPSCTVTTSEHFFNEEMLIEPECDISRFANGKAWETMAPGTNHEKYLNLKRAPLDGPSQTISQRGGNVSTASVTHPTEKRKFSIAELKRICAFPDDFILKGTYAQQWERLGRAVPPVMMQKIASTIQHDILDVIKERGKI